MSTPFLRKLQLCDFGRIRANRLRKLCLVCIKTIPRLEGAAASPVGLRVAGARARLGGPHPRRRGPGPRAPLASLGSALRLRPAPRPKSNKKGVLFNSRGLNKTAFLVRFWAGPVALRPAAGPPPFGLRAPCAPRGPLPRSWCLPGASPGARCCPTVPPGALIASAQEGHPP